MCKANLNQKDFKALLCNLHITNLIPLLDRIQHYLGYPTEIIQNYIINSAEDLIKLRKYLKENPDSYAIVIANTDDELFYIDTKEELNSSSFDSLYIEFAYFIQSDNSTFTILFCID